MSTLAEYNADLVVALDIITGGAQRVSDERRQDRVPTGGNSYQLRHSAEPLDLSGSGHGNDAPQQFRTNILVYHYLDLSPLESERDYTLGEMLVMQSDLLFHGLWIPGWPLAPAHALTTVIDFYGETAPIIPNSFERIGRVISFEVSASVTLAV